MGNIMKPGSCNLIIVCTVLAVGLAGCGGRGSDDPPVNDISIQDDGPINEEQNDNVNQSFSDTVAPLVGEWRLQTNDELLYLDISTGGVITESIFDVEGNCVVSTADLQMSIDSNGLLFAMSPLNDSGEPDSILVNPDLQLIQTGLLEVVDNNPDEAVTYLATMVTTQDSIYALPVCSTVQVQSNPETLTYTDTFLQIDYPASWILENNVDGIDAQFLSPEINEFGGSDNCTVVSAFAPDTNLESITNEVIFLFDSRPAPRTSYLTVNGTPMSRTFGSYTFFGITNDDVVLQLAYSNNYFHQIFCFSGAGEREVILDSMVVR